MALRIKIAPAILVPVAFTLLGVVVVLAVVVVGWGRGAVTKANFDRIHEGMTLAEVEAVVGRPRSIGHTLRTRAGDVRIDSWENLNGDFIRLFFKDEVVLSKGWYTVADKIHRAWAVLWSHPLPSPPVSSLSLSGAK